MKVLYFSLIAIAMIVFLTIGVGQARADNANGVYIQSIKVQPSTVKVGDTFTITITLANNSTVPIWLDGGKCSVADAQASFFTVNFDNHAKIKAKDIFCAGVGWSQLLDPGKNITETSPDYTVTYVATESGTASATMTFSYHVINQTDPAQPGFSQTISKSFLFTILDNNTGTRVISETVPSPLKQSESGIQAKNVVCKEGLQLVIKSEDGTPACVKPDDAYILIYRSWAKEFIQYTTNNLSLCEGTQVSSGEIGQNIFPVLIMSPNSTATVCVTYKFNSDWQTYPNKDVYPHGILETCCFIHMESHSSPDSSNKFEILANPPLFNVTNIHNGSKLSVIYKIYAKPDSGGFYDTSVPFDGCLSYPLAVGYDQSQIDATKFHADFNIPCFNTIENVDSVNIISGMTYKAVQFP
ncbi:MAG TPA: hypothetical protein VJ771_06025 [Candidatus Nitrosotalea sp.]|nr:hypothetical protein [Candidatus Nitrosotalea sp.]